MFKFLRSTLPLLLLAAGACFAGTDAATSEMLMKKSGLWQQMAEIPTQMRTGMAAAVDKQTPKPDAASSDRLLRAITEAFALERLHATSLASMSSNLDPSHVKPLQAWFDSADGMAVRKLEEAGAADTTELNVVVQEGNALLEASTSTRRALVNNIVETTKAAELMTDLTLNTVLAIGRGVASLPQGQGGPSVPELQATLQAQRPQLQQAMAGVAIASYARIYRTLPDDVLSRYAALLRSDAGRHFNEVGFQALSAAFVEASADFGSKLAAAKAQTGS